MQSCTKLRKGNSTVSQLGGSDRTVGNRSLNVRFQNPSDWVSSQSNNVVFQSEGCTSRNITEGNEGSFILCKFTCFVRVSRTSPSTGRSNVDSVVALAGLEPNKNTVTVFNWVTIDVCKTRQRTWLLGGNNTNLEEVQTLKGNDVFCVLEKSSLLILIQYLKG